METGRLVFRGPGAELLAHPRLRDAYLGDYFGAGATTSGSCTGPGTEVP